MTKLIVNLPAVFLQQAFDERYRKDLFTYIQRRSILWDSYPDKQKWIQAANALMKIDRLSAYRLLGTFPHFLEDLSCETLEERLCIGGLCIHYQAVSTWLFHFNCTTWRDPRLMHPEQFDPPISFWHEYEVKAKLSQLFFEMIGGYCDRFYKATGEEIYPGFVWLISEASQCRRMLQPVKSALTMNSVYQNSRKYREFMTSPMKGARLPWESEEAICEAIIEDADDIDRQFLPDYLLDNYDKVILHLCRMLAANDSKFRKAYWTPYWSVYKSLHSQAQNRGYKAVNVNSAPPSKKREIRKKRTKPSNHKGFGQNQG